MFLAGLAVGSPVAGIVIDRFGTRYVVSAGLIIGATGSLLTMAARSMEVLNASAMLTGLAVSVVIPATCALFATYTEERRGGANGLRQCVAGLTGAGLVVLYPTIFRNLEWRVFVGCSAGASLIAAACWFLAARSFPRSQPGGNVLRGLLGISALGCFLTYLGYFACLNTIEFWFGRQFGTRMGFAMPLIGCLASLVSGWWSDRLVRGGSGSALKIRKRFVLCGLLLSGLVGLIPSLGENGFLVFLLGMVSAAGLGGAIPNVWAIVQRAAPVGTAGTWGGVQVVFGRPMVLIIEYLINPYRVDGSSGLVLAAGFGLAAAAAIALLVRPGDTGRFPATGAGVRTGMN